MYFQILFIHGKFLSRITKLTSFFFSLSFPHSCFFSFSLSLMQKECNRKYRQLRLFSAETIRGSYCSRDPSLAVILGVSQSNKSQVALANEYRSDPIVIHPRRYGSFDLEKRPSSSPQPIVGLSHKVKCFSFLVFGGLKIARE